MLLSQGIDWRKWGITVSDNVSYLPASPTTGFSGIPGIGEPIGEPLPPSDQSILALHTHIVDNNASGNVWVTLDRATTLKGSVSSALMRYPDGNGLNINELTANGVLTRRIDARNSLIGTYQYSQYGYPDYDFSFQCQRRAFWHQTRVECKDYFTNIGGTRVEGQFEQRDHTLFNGGISECVG